MFVNESFSIPRKKSINKISYVRILPDSGCGFGKSGCEDRVVGDMGGGGGGVYNALNGLREVALHCNTSQALFDTVSIQLRCRQENSALPGMYQRVNIPGRMYQRVKIILLSSLSHESAV
jgi:hypothetical protein